MKTAVDLPDDLFREVKVRAAEEGRKLKEVFADLLRAGLVASRPCGTDEGPKFGISKISGLPVILATGPATLAHTMTADRIDEILLEQEVEWYSKSSGC